MTYFMHFVILFNLVFYCLSLELKSNNGSLEEGQLCTIYDSEQTIGCCTPFFRCVGAILGDDANNTMCSKENNIICCPNPCKIDATPDPPAPERISEIKCLEYIHFSIFNESKQNFNLNANGQKTEDDTLANAGFTIGDRKSLNATNEDSTKTEYETLHIIVGGEDAAVFEFPHMAAIGWHFPNGSLAFKCGGTLISDKFILTAGHCTSAPNFELAQREPSVVRLREQNLLNNDQEKKEPIDIPIKKIIKHPNYKPPKKYYDIALIELSESVKFSSDVLPACLWTKDSFEENEVAIITGWGAVRSGENKNSMILQKADVHVIDDAICDSLYQRYRNRHWMGLKDHQLCAGILEGGVDSCQGDSGGPLQFLDDTYNKLHYSVIGVTSFGRNCAKPDQPGIYSKVSKFVDWIESVVWSDQETN